MTLVSLSTPTTAPTALGSALLVGRLERAAMPAFLEFLSASGQAGSLVLEGPGEQEGLVLVTGGSVVHAQCPGPDGALTGGVEALRAIVGWPHAYVEFRPNLPEDAPRSITTPILGALLEGARLEDEAERELGPDARLRLRNNLNGYDGLTDAGKVVLSRVRTLGRTHATVTMRDLRRELPGAGVGTTVADLVRRGLLEVEGRRPTLETRVNNRGELLAAIVPRRVRAERELGRNAKPLALMLLSLVNGERTAEAIRAELKVPPGRLRSVLMSLRNAGLIDF